MYLLLPVWHPAVLWHELWPSWDRQVVQSRHVWDAIACACEDEWRVLQRLSFLWDGVIWLGASQCVRSLASHHCPIERVRGAQACSVVRFGT